MSLYSIAQASLTTPVDRKRRPAIDGGQIARTLLLLALVAAGLAVMARQGHAAGGEMRVHATTSGIEPFPHALAGEGVAARR